MQGSAAVRVSPLLRAVLACAADADTTTMQGGGPQCWHPGVSRNALSNACCDLLHSPKCMHVCTTAAAVFCSFPLA